MRSERLKKKKSGIINKNMSSGKKKKGREGCKEENEYSFRKRRQQRIRGWEVNEDDVKC